MMTRRKASNDISNRRGNSGNRRKGRLRGRRESGRDSNSIIRSGSNISKVKDNGHISRLRNRSSNRDGITNR